MDRFVLHSGREPENYVVRIDGQDVAERLLALTVTLKRGKGCTVKVVLRDKDDDKKKEVVEGTPAQITVTADEKPEVSVQPVTTVTTGDAVAEKAPTSREVKSDDEDAAQAE